MLQNILTDYSIGHALVKRRIKSFSLIESGTFSDENKQ
jgi:hypothetical protein